MNSRRADNLSGFLFLPRSFITRIKIHKKKKPATRVFKCIIYSVPSPSSLRIILQDHPSNRPTLSRCIDYEFHAIIESSEERREDEAIARVNFSLR